MKMVERTLQTIAVFFVGLSVAMAIQVTIPKPEYEFARGDNITLPCTFTTTSPNRKTGVVTWTMEGDEEITILTFFGGSNVLDIKSVYEGRVNLEHDLDKGKANLKLSSITLAENKRFECKVQIPQDDEGTLTATTRLVVLVAPSPPICKIEGQAEYGQNIKLTCVSEEGSPPPAYKWQSHDVNNAPRPNPPKATDEKGVLSLFNITREVSGYYICTSSNKIRSAKCNLTLSVMPPSMNMGMTGGIIGGVLAAIVVLAIMIYCCCCRKKKETEEYAMGKPEGGAFHDSEPGEDRNRDSERENHDRHLDSRDRPSERSDYDDRQSDYSRRNDRYSDREDDRRERYDDRYDDRRDRYNDRYDDRYDDRRDRYDDRHEDRYDDRPSSRNHYDDRDRPPSVPPNKPSRDNYD